MSPGILILRIVIIAAAAYLGLVLLVFLRQKKFIYFPLADWVSTPDQVGLIYEDVIIPTTDGQRLSAWFVPAGPSGKTILMLHGNGGNISHRLETIGIFHRLGCNVLIVDYRGYGKSTGSPSEQGTYTDAQAAWDYLKNSRGIAAEQIVIFGRSLGGAVASWLAVRTKPGGVILESTFTSVPDRGAELYPYLPVRLLSHYRYSNIDRIKQIKSPLLIVHSRNDDIVPFHHGEKLYEAANEPKTFVEINGAHNDGFLNSGGKYTEALRAFLAGL